jgi:hypothetical protein
MINHQYQMLMVYHRASDWKVLSRTSGGEECGEQQLLIYLCKQLLFKANPASTAANAAV